MRFIPLIVIVLLINNSLFSSPQKLKTNRRFDLLSVAEQKNQRQRLKKCSFLLNTRAFYFAGSYLSADRLNKVVSESADGMLTRALREEFQQPIDTSDFILFLDDIITAFNKGEVQPSQVWISSGRARRAGILLHPDDIFKNKARRYGAGSKPIDLDKPKRPELLTPAHDGDVLGPRWTARYKNTYGEQAKLRELHKYSRGSNFVKNIASLIKQLRSQGAQVAIHSAYRKRQRGYLLWGSFILSRAKSQKQLKTLIKNLESVNREYKLGVQIKWYDKKGWLRTKEMARQMADAYDVVYATKRGALYSDHYDGKAVDITATGLPRTLQLSAPDGASKTFDFSKNEHSRDLNLTKELIDWVEIHFNIKKLRSDYPHWSKK